VIDEPPNGFLMTPRQHLHWARLARKLGRADLAKHHEQLARAIESIARRRTEEPMGAEP
jgi:hypothetical protein